MSVGILATWCPQEGDIPTGDPCHPCGPKPITVSQYWYTLGNIEVFLWNGGYWMAGQLPPGYGTPEYAVLSAGITFTIKALGDDGTIIGSEDISLMPQPSPPGNANICLFPKTFLGFPRTVSSFNITSSAGPYGPKIYVYAEGYGPEPY